jgi:putative ABC transport system permease protein
MGDRVKANLNKDLDILGGATVIRLAFNDMNVPGTRPQEFEPATVEGLRALPGVGTVSQVTKDIDWNRIKWKGRNYAMPVQGVDAEYWHTNGYNAKTGYLFTTEQVENRELVCVVGPTIAMNLFGTLDVAGAYVPIWNDYFRIVGVLEGLRIGDRVKFALVPVTTAVDRSPKKLMVNELFLRCKTWDDVRPVAAEIPKVVAANQSADFLFVDVAWDPLDRFIMILWWVELFIRLSIGATLTLGGFGIWNGMMSSVAARTREIGLKKAMGAGRGDILLQFLSEAVFTSFGAAFVGIVAGRIVVEIVSNMLHTPPDNALFLKYSLGSLAFALFLGIVAGFYPAFKASRMDAVTAIRYE